MPCATDSHRAVAEQALWERRPLDALVAVQAGLERTEDPALVWLGVRAAADVTGDAATVRRAHEAGFRLLERVARADRRDAHAVTAAAEGTRLRRLADPEAFAAAAAAWDRAGRRHASAYCRFRQAEALLERRHRRAAARVLAGAFAIADALGYAPLLAQMDRLAERGRIDVAPAMQDSTPPAGGPAALTTRERAVLSLVARGLTDRDVGKALFVTEKAAGCHVASILAKLSARSRVEAAAAAHRLGLVDA